MISDDTEHTVFVAQCLAKSGGDPADFQRRLAWRLRFWLLCLPAGIGFATLRAIVKLWLGFPPSRSGVFSAGNGPAMRSAVIGVFFENDPDRLAAYVHASTRLTHTDPKAEIAALAVARTAAFASAGEHPGTVEELWRSIGPSDEQWQSLITAILSSRDQDHSVAEFAQSIGLHKGVSGYAYHSVPVALYAWLRHSGDFRTGLEAVINCGGDTDTVGAIAGSLLALNSPIPKEWQESIADYPVSTTYLTELARALEASRKGGGIPTPSFNWLALPFRNLLFLIVVLFHGFRRLIPI
jgi:ADP-ribosylglycohydrolase